MCYCCKEKCVKISMIVLNMLIIVSRTLRYFSLMALILIRFEFGFISDANLISEAIFEGQFDQLF
jgi:hypothetical protein